MTTKQPIVTVIKVGGSLLDWSELADHLSEFLQSQLDGKDRIVLVPGGGGVVEAIRSLDRVHRFGDVEAHFLAIRALDLTAEILASVVAESRVVNDLAGIEGCWAAGTVPILASYRWIREAEASNGPKLPASWDVTSDSIAAWLALEMAADRLILLKSTELTFGWTRSEAATAGLVDPMFPRVACRLKQVAYRNLRDPTGPLIALPE